MFLRKPAKQPKRDHPHGTKNGERKEELFVTGVPLEKKGGGGAPAAKKESIAITLTNGVSKNLEM